MQNNAKLQKCCRHLQTMLFGRRWNCNAFRVLEEVLISGDCDEDDDDADDQPILAATASKCLKAFKVKRR